MAKSKNFTVIEAISESSTLGSLLLRMEAAQEAFAQALQVLPPGLHPTVKAGPITDGVWCLLVNTASAMGKLRQLSPVILTRVQAKGLAIRAIALKRVYDCT